MPSTSTRGFWFPVNVEMPLIQNWIADMAGYMASYWLIVAMLAYLFFYGVSGSKNVNTDIPVDDEVIDAL